MKPNRRFVVFIASFLLIFVVGITIQVVAQTIADLRATNTSQLVVDNNNNGLADGGDVIEYTVNIANCSPNTISGMNYQSDIDPNTVLIPSSVQVTIQGTGLCGGGTVDNPPPAPTTTPPPVPVNPIVTTTTPANGATEVALNSNITITFSEDVVVAGDWFDVVCTTSGTFNISSANITVSGGPATFTLDPNVDLQVGETCTVTVFATGVTDSEALNPLADYVFSFETETPPTITATNPLNGATGVLNTTDIIITFDEPVIVTAASFILECPSTVPFAGGFAVTGSGTNVATINPTGNLPSGTTCQVTVIAAQVSDVDPNDPPDLLDGNGDDIEGDNYVFGFTTDVDAAPTVITVSPVAGATSVPNSTNITITFSELVDINGAGDFALECGGNPQGYTVITPATLPASTTIVVIDPASPLPDGETCQVTVFTSVTDSDMDDPPNNMAANFVWTFTTEAPPSVTTTTPADLATGVSTGANIVIDFDEPVDVTTSSFTIECPIGTPFTYTIAGSGTNSITLDPTVNLPANQTCRVTVVALQVADSDPIDPPNNMVADYIFTFDTVADTAPIASSPLDGATGVATSTNIVVNFNEPVDVTAGAFDVTCLVGPAITFIVTPALPTSNQTSITLDPIGNLPATTTCTVSVFQANVTDTDTDEPPDNMAADYIFSFDTVVDLAPTVNQPAIVPASTSTGANSASLNNPVSTTPTITIPFSEAVDVASGAFTLVCNATPVGITVNPVLPAVGATSFDISPLSALTEGANCALTVSQANVTDSDTDDPPNFMANDFTLSFAVDTAPAETLTETEVGNTFQDVTGAGANNVDLDSDIRITFTEAVTVTFPANGLQCPGGNNIPVTVTTNNAATIVLNPDVNLPLNTSCVLNIPAANISDVDTADAPDNPVAGVNHTFQTADDDAPTVTTNPANGGSNIAVNSNITVTFNEPVTLTGAWFDLTCSVSGTRTSTGELTGTGITIIENTPDLVYTIDPTVDFANGDLCFITIASANVVDNDLIDPPNNLDGDANGDILDDFDNYSAAFSTTDTPPQVTSTTPTNTATVASNQAVTLNFSEAVDIAAGAFTFTCNATPITGGFNTSVVLPASAVTTITLTPVNPLPFGANCVVTAISSLVVDSDPVDPPNFLDGDNSGDLIDDVDNFVLNFTVDAQATENTTQVEIAGVPSPIAGAVNVDLDTNIVITFSEAVNVNLTSFALNCAGPIAFTVSGSGTATITVDPTPATLPINTLCSFDIIAANITDVDTFDPPDLLDADVNYTFTTVNDNPPDVFSAEAEVGGVFTALPLGVGQFADPDTDLRITFSEAVTVSGNWAELDCTLSGIQDVTGGLGVTDADPVFTLNPATNLTPGEACQLTIFGANISDDDAIDPPDTMSPDAVFTFTVQDTAPRVDTATSTPINGATVPNNQTVTINFTEMVDIGAGGITFECNATPVAFIPALPQNNVNTITLTPSVALTNGANCTVTLVSTLVTDDDPVDPPNELDGDNSGDIVDGDADNFVLNFTVDMPPAPLTTPNVDVGGVPTFLPLGGAQRADVGTNIRLTFTENVDATVAGVTLECPAGSPIPFAGLPVANNNTITINPTSNLPGDTLCVVTLVNTGISDTDTFDPPNQLDGNGNGVEGDSIAFTFTTQSIANDDAYTVTPHLTYTSPTGVRANDNPTTATITGFGPTLVAANSTVPNGTNFITAGGAGGRVIMNPDGTFIFYPDAGDNNASGTVTFFYTISGGDTAQVTLTFEAEEFIWFVDGSGACTVGTGTNVGTQACPATDVPTVAAVDTANDVIFVADGNYTCGVVATGITLETGEWIIGDGSSSNLGALIASRVTPVAGSDFAPYNTFSGTDPVFNSSSGDCFTLTSNNEIRGLRIDNTTGYAIASAVNIGTSTAVEVNVTGTGGILNFTGGGTLNGAFETLSSTAHTNNMILLIGMSGTITNSVASSIAHNTANATVDINGGNPAFTYTGTITKTAGGYVVSVANTTSNTVSVTGAITQNVAIGQGIFVNNVAGTVTFNTLNLGSLGTRMTNTPITISNSNGTVNLGTVNVFTNNVTAMNATNNDGTINSTTGVINATNGRAINIDGPAGLTTLGMTLTSVSSTNSTTNGILIQDTNGTFTVTGDGNPATHTNGAGGTISNTTGEAVVLNNTSNITLNDMIISNTGSHGFIGENVNGLVLDNVDMSNIGNNDNEYGLNFTTGAGANLIGTVVLDNVTITNVADHMVYIENFSGALNLTITQSIFEDTISTTACGGGNCNGNALLLRADGTSSMDIVIDTNQFNRIDGVGISANPEGNSGAVMEIDILNNTFTANAYAGPSNTNNGETAISLRNAQGNSVMRFDVNNNIISNYTGELALGVIEVEAGDFTLSNGAIRNNTINHAYDGNVIQVFVDGANTSGFGTTSAILNVTVSGNTVPASLSVFGVSLLANNNSAIAGSTSSLNLIATNNNFLANATGASRRTVTVNVRDFNNACVDIRTNTIAAGTGGTQPSINLSYNGSGTVRLQGMVGSGDANAIAYLGANNTLAVAAISGPNDNITNATCTVPSYP